MDDYLDIGHGVSIKFSEHKGLVVGIHERHPDKRDPNHLCCGFVFFNTPNNEAIRNGSPVWTVESIDPLTLSTVHPVSYVREPRLHSKREVGPCLTVHLGDELTSIVVDQLSCLDLVLDRNIAQVKIH